MLRKDLGKQKQRGLRKREEDAEEEPTQPHGEKRNEKISGSESSELVSCGQRAEKGGGKDEGMDRNLTNGGGEGTGP